MVIIEHAQVHSEATRQIGTVVGCGDDESIGVIVPHCPCDVGILAWLRLNEEIRAVVPVLAHEVASDEGVSHVARLQILEHNWHCCGGHCGVDNVVESAGDAGYRLP